MSAAQQQGIFRARSRNGRLYVECSASAGRLLKTVFKGARWTPENGWDLSDTEMTRDKLRRISAEYRARCAAEAAAAEAAEKEALDELELAEAIDAEIAQMHARIRTAHQEAQAHRDAAEKSRALLAEIDVEEVERAEAAARSAKLDADAERRKVRAAVSRVIDVDSVQSDVEAVASMMRSMRPDRHAIAKVQERLCAARDKLAEIGLESWQIGQARTANANRPDRDRFTAGCIVEAMRKIEE